MQTVSTSIQLKKIISSWFSFLVLFLLLLIPLVYNGFESVQAQQQEQNQTALVSVGGANLLASLSTTPDSQSKGLAIKESLKENEGMLFIFESPQKYSFWMKDMKFPIDIIWIDSAGKIVHIEKNLPPCVFLLPCPSYTPDADSLYVLEVVSNFTNKFDINIGYPVYSIVIKQSQG
jgi:uncharacterized membrane protein (UPF0127 family)